MRGMHLGAVGTIETWNAEAAAGSIRLEDGLLVAFDRSACGFSHVGGCDPRVGLRVRVARWTDGRAAIVNPIGKPTAVRGVVANMRGEGASTFCNLDGIHIYGRACVGFFLENGQDVIVTELCASNNQAQAVYLATDAPQSVVDAAIEHAARAAELEAYRATAIADEERRRDEALERQFEEREARGAEYDERVAARARDGEPSDEEIYQALEPRLAAVLAAPYDDEPRLALARSLRAEGDPYGELIELQLSAQRDANAEKRLLKKVAATWRAPQGVFGTTRFERGFLASATLSKKADVLAASNVRGDWRLGTLERVAFDRSQKRQHDIARVYRELVTGPTMTALRELDMVLLDDVTRAPAFARGRVRTLTRVRWTNQRVIEQLASPELDAIEEIELEATDKQFPTLLERLADDTPDVLERRPRRLRFVNRGCSYVDRRDLLIAYWSDLPVTSAAVWDIQLERTPDGTVLRFAGWKAYSDCWVYPGFDCLPVFGRNTTNVVVVEAHGAVEPDERDRAKLAEVFPGVAMRFIPRPETKVDEGSCWF